MLNGSRALIALAAAAVVLSGGGQANADPPAACVVLPDGSRQCDVVAQPPSTPGTSIPGTPISAGSGRKKPGTRTCESFGVPVDCSSEDGVWNAAKQCWVEPMSPQPPVTDPLWEGRTEGTIYWATCPDTTGLVSIGGDHAFWAPSAGLPGASAAVNPADVAEEAVDSMNLRAVEIGITPPPGPDSHTLLGLPTWLWVADPAPSTWGPISRTASSDGVSVTATAQVQKVVWNMGDGAEVSCGKGTKYEVSFDDAPSPDCGHRYSAPGTYTVTATSFWEADWSGAGQSGTISFTLERDTTVTVREAFALVDEQG